MAEPGVLVALVSLTLVVLGASPKEQGLCHSTSNPSFSHCPSEIFFPAGEDQTKGERRAERH